MKTQNHIKSILLSLVLLLMIVTPVSAQGIIYGDGVASGETVNGDIVLTGQNVTIDGIINGNVFVLGNQVTVNGVVNGSLAVLGQNVDINGRVSGGAYMTALTLDIGSTGLLERDLYIASVSLEAAPGSRISRDLYAAGLDAGLNGQVGRTLHTTIGPLQLYNGLMHLLGFDELAVDLRFPIRTPEPGSASTLVPTPSPENSGTRLLPTRAYVEQVHRADNMPKPSDPEDETNPWGIWTLRVLREWGSLFVLGLLVYWLLRRRLEASETALKERPLNALAVGLLVLVISINLFGVAVLVGALIFTLGLGLGYLGLWALSVAFWLLGFSCLTVLVILLWALIVYGTKVIVAYALVNWLFEKLLPEVKAAWVGIFALLLGTLVYALLRSIPIAGWMFAVLVTAAGMGAAWQGLRRQPQAIPAPEPSSARKRVRKPRTETPAE